MLNSVACRGEAAREAFARALARRELNPAWKRLEAGLREIIRAGLQPLKPGFSSRTRTSRATALNQGGLSFSEIIYRVRK